VVNLQNKDQFDHCSLSASLVDVCADVVCCRRWWLISNTSSHCRRLNNVL